MRGNLTDSPSALHSIHLSIQYILNCGYESAGSCHGGSAEGAFDFIQTSGIIPFESVQPYEACSRESTEDPYSPGTGCGAQRDYSCSAMNTARTCSTFADSGGECVALSNFPNATIAEWGMVQGAAQLPERSGTRSRY